MAKHKYENSVFCPYYLEESEECIKCESVPGAAALSLIFKTKEEKYRWQLTHCISITDRSCVYRSSLNDIYFGKGAGI